MNKKQLQNWIKNDKFCNKVFHSSITKKDIKEVAEKLRVFIPETPSEKDNAFLINKSFLKWKKNYIELIFKDDEFNMCPYIQDKEDFVWKFNTTVTGELVMTKSQFDSWRRIPSKFDDFKTRKYEITGEGDFEAGNWYSRDEILGRIFNQKNTKPLLFVKKRMIPISRIASHLERKLEDYTLKDEFQEIWQQITEALERMGVTFYTCSENGNEKYIWYEDFAIIPFIALDPTKFKQSLPWPAIPVNVLLDIQEDDYESTLRFLHQASLLRSIKRYKSNTSYLVQCSYMEDNNKDSFQYGFWIKTYANEEYSLVMDAIIDYIGNSDNYQNSQEKSLEENKRNYTKEQKSMETDFVHWYGEWGKYMLKNIKEKTIKQGITWPPDCLSCIMNLSMYYPNILTQKLTKPSSLLLEITYPLFYVQKSNVLKVVPEKFKCFFLIDKKSFKSDFITEISR